MSTQPPEEFLRAIRLAGRLYRLTKDPLMPSAIGLLGNAYASILSGEDPPEVALTALGAVQRMEQARLTLYAFSDIEGAATERDPDE